MSTLDLPSNLENTTYFVNENYRGLSESEIRTQLNALNIVKIPGLLENHSILIIRSPNIPTIVVCMMDSKDICLIAYMFS